MAASDGPAPRPVPPSPARGVGLGSGGAGSAGPGSRLNDEALQAMLDRDPMAWTRRSGFVERFLAEPDWLTALVIWVGGRLRLEPRATLDRLAQWVDRDIALIDDAITEQVNAIIHHPRFQQLESSWRGVRGLVDKAGVDSDERVVVRVLDVTWKELARDAERAVEFDQSALFDKVYNEEYGRPGGEPFGVLIGDYQIRHKPSAEHPIDDLEVLAAIGGVAAAAFAPFICGAHPSLLGLDHFVQLERHGDLGRRFASDEYIKWRALRDQEDSRYVGLALPNTLMRLPYTATHATVVRRLCRTCRQDLRDVDDGLCPKCKRPFDAEVSDSQRTETLGFRFTEDVEGPDRSKYLWGNAAFAFGGVLIRAFVDCGWLADIRGFDRNEERGGVVTGLPVHSFGLDAPDVAPKMSTDVVVSDAQENEIASLGFIPLCRCHDTEFSVFYSNASLQKPKVYADDNTSLNARMSSMLQYTLCVSRFAHFLKVQVRDRIGAGTHAQELGNRLRDWINDYVTPDSLAAADVKARYPLRKATVDVRDTPGRPGTFQCLMKLCPHYQLDDVQVTVRMATQLSGSSPR